MEDDKSACRRSQDFAARMSKLSKSRPNTAREKCEQSLLPVRVTKNRAPGPTCETWVANYPGAWVSVYLYGFLRYDMHVHTYPHLSHNRAQNARNNETTSEPSTLVESDLQCFRQDAKEANSESPHNIYAGHNRHQAFARATWNTPQEPAAPIYCSRSEKGRGSNEPQTTTRRTSVPRD